MKKMATVISAIIILSFSLCFVGCSNQKTNRTSYQIDCTLDGHVLTGKQVLTFYNSSQTTIKTLKFNLYANAFRKDAQYSPIGSQYLSRAYPNGLNYGDIKINSVYQSGWKIEHEVCGQDKNVLSVELKDEVFPDERATIEIDYVINLANVIARTGYNEKTINLANFYPVLCALDGGTFYECLYYSTGDPYYSDCADYKVTLTCDKKYTVASSGKQVSFKENQDTFTRTYSLSCARSFAFVLSENFECITDKSTGTEINYYFYNDQNPLKSIEYGIRAINLFNQKFGEYAYPTYSIVQTPFIQGGMEFPALVMISDDLSGLPYGEVIVHETAHQWWQSAVGNNEIEYGFLDEGLSEYSVVLYYESFPEHGYSRQDLISASEKTFRTFCTVYDKIYNKIDTSMIRSLKDFSSEYEYVNIAYVKPCIMYDSLRNTIGDERFFKALKRYYSQYKFKNVQPDDLVGAFEKVGADTNGFFKSFFDGTAII